MGTDKASGSRVGREKSRKPLDHLTEDVLAAQRAGESYGQWKAKHPHTAGLYDEPEILEVDPDKRLLTCVCCGKAFPMPRYAANRQCCSDECKRKINRQRDMERNPEKYQPKPCPICGKMVQPDRGRVYCSGACKTEGCRRKARERERAKREAMKNG